MSQQIESIEKKIVTTGINVGTNVKTKFMKPFITSASPSGLYMIDTEITLDRIKASAKFINRTGAENVIACSSKTIGKVPIEKFCELVGAKSNTGRFKPGTLTNPSLDYYTEPKLLLVSDPQADQQAVTEATNAGIPVIGVANTNNITSKLDVVIPANNNGHKSLAAVYWLLAREILIERGQLQESEQIKYEIEDFETKNTEDEEIE